MIPYVCKRRCDHHCIVCSPYHKLPVWTCQTMHGVTASTHIMISWAFTLFQQFDYLQTLVGFPYKLLLANHHEEMHSSHPTGEEATQSWQHKRLRSSLYPSLPQGQRFHHSQCHMFDCTLLQLVLLCIYQSSLMESVLQWKPTCSQRPSFPLEVALGPMSCFSGEHTSLLSLHRSTLDLVFAHLQSFGMDNDCNDATNALCAG